MKQKGNENPKSVISNMVYTITEAVKGFLTANDHEKMNFKKSRVIIALFQIAHYIIVFLLESSFTDRPFASAGVVLFAFLIWFAVSIITNGALKIKYLHWLAGVPIFLVIGVIFGAKYIAFLIIMWIFDLIVCIVIDLLFRNYKKGG